METKHLKHADWVEKMKRSHAGVELGQDYKLEMPPTQKQKIKHPKSAEQGVIPKLGSSLMIIGKSGSGKSVLLYNLLHDKRFYNGAFDRIFLFSATGDVDDILDQLNLEPGQIFTDLKEGIEGLKMIQNHQKHEIATHGNVKALQYALVFDDVIGDSHFITSPPFLRSFIAPRHHNETTFLCSQHLRVVPKKCRMQASWIALFPCSKSEMETITEEYCPSFLSKRSFERMLEDVWKSSPFQFLSIHMKQPEDKKYRMGMTQVLDLEAYRNL